MSVTSVYERLSLNGYICSFLQVNNLVPDAKLTLTCDSTIVIFPGVHTDIAGAT